MSRPVYASQRVPLALPHSQNLKLPRGCLVLVIQAVSIEVQFPGGGLVLVIQAVGGCVEAQTGSTVALSGKAGWGLAEVGAHPIGAHRTEGSPRSRQLVVHRAQIGSTVHAAKVGRGAGVALSVGRSLGVGHRVGPLHAGG